MKVVFPIFATHTEARCFRCHGLLAGEPIASGYPEGQWNRRCPYCGMLTWYDVRP